MLSSTRRILPTSIGGANIASRATSMMFSRGMTILSKESAEEFKKEVRLILCSTKCICTVKAAYYSIGDFGHQ